MFFFFFNLSIFFNDLKFWLEKLSWKGKLVRDVFVYLSCQILVAGLEVEK